MRSLALGLGGLLAAAALLLGSGCIDASRVARAGADADVVDDAADAIVVDDGVEDDEHVAEETEVVAAETEVDVPETEVDVQEVVTEDTQFVAEDTEVVVGDTHSVPECDSDDACIASHPPAAPCYAWRCSDAHVCVTVSDDGASCASDSLCALDAHCEEGQCVPIAWRAVGAACGSRACTSGFALGFGACDDDHVCRTVPTPLGNADLSRSSWFVVFEDDDANVHDDIGVATATGSLAFVDGTATLSARTWMPAPFGLYPGWDAVGAADRAVQYCESWDGRVALGTADGSQTRFDAAVARDGSLLIGSDGGSQALLVGVPIDATLPADLKVSGNFFLSELHLVNEHFVSTFGRLRFLDNELQTADVIDSTGAPGGSYAASGVPASLQCESGGRCSLAFDVSGGRHFAWQGIVSASHAMLFANRGAEGGALPGHALLVPTPPEFPELIDGPWFGLNLQTDLAQPGAPDPASLLQWSVARDLVGGVSGTVTTSGPAVDVGEVAGNYSVVGVDLPFSEVVTTGLAALGTRGYRGAIAIGGNALTAFQATVVQRRVVMVPSRVDIMLGVRLTPYKALFP